MKLVKQRTSGDCGIACLSMILNKDYETIEYELNEIIEYDEDRDISIHGIDIDDIFRYLKDSNIPFNISSWFGSNRAIAIVPSLNADIGLHYIAYDGKEIFDPSKGPLLWPDNAPINKDGKRILPIAVVISIENIAM